MVSFKIVVHVLLYVLATIGAVLACVTLYVQCRSAAPGQRSWTRQMMEGVASLLLVGGFLLSGPLLVCGFVPSFGWFRWWYPLVALSIPGLCIALDLLSHTVTWQKQALRRGDPEEREAAARTLARGGQRSLEPLIQALADPCPAVRQAAAEALGNLGCRGAVEHVTLSLADCSASVRRQAAKALARLGEPEWQAWVRGDEQDFRRLAQSGEPRAAQMIAPLVRALEGGDWSTATAAARALGELGDARAIGALRRALMHQFGHVRGAAAHALAELGQPEGQLPINGAHDDFVRLLESGYRYRFEFTIQALRNGSSEAAEALGSCGDRRAVGALIEALQTEDECLLRSAAVALGSLGDERAVQPLVRALGRGKWKYSVQTDLIVALGQFEDERVVEPLFRAVQHGWGDDGCSAAVALIRLASSHPSWLRNCWSSIRDSVEGLHKDIDVPRCDSFSGGHHTDWTLHWPAEAPPTAKATPRTLKIRCPRCRKALRVPRSHAATRVRCPFCQQWMVLRAKPDAAQSSGDDPTLDF